VYANSALLGIKGPPALETEIEARPMGRAQLLQRPIRELMFAMHEGEQHLVQMPCRSRIATWVLALSAQLHFTY
jgi:hypothetical protein